MYLPGPIVLLLHCWVNHALNADGNIQFLDRWERAWIHSSERTCFQRHLHLHSAVQIAYTIFLRSYMVGLPFASPAPSCNSPLLTLSWSILGHHSVHMRSLPGLWLLLPFTENTPHTTLKFACLILSTFPWSCLSALRYGSSWASLPGLVSGPWHSWTCVTTTLGTLPCNNLMATFLAQWDASFTTTSSDV